MSYLREDCGQTFVEYALMVALIAIVVAAFMTSDVLPAVEALYGALAGLF